MRRGLPPFSPYDLAVLRVCRRNGWSIERDWDSLSAWEQNEWLAEDRRHSLLLEKLTEGLTEREGLYTPEVHAMLMLASM